jgi:uncharacterized protein (TIGR03084 family)
MPSLSDLVADLAAEHASLDAVVGDLPARAWSTPTPAAGWDVRDSISHLGFFDGTAALALTDPEAFAAHRAQPAPPTDLGPADVALGRSLGDPARLLDRWRAGRTGLVDAIRGVPHEGRGVRVPWYGPPMSVGSFVTARLMETWAHGVDVRDALGAPLDAGSRLRHVCHIGIAARPFAFRAHRLEDPGDPIRVEAAAPDGGVWTWGPPDAADRVTGPAVELALVLTQRRHPGRTSVRAVGPVAAAWLSVAQAFAGPGTVPDPDR